MIQLGGFTAAKEMARLPFGRQSGQHFHYNADVQRRWDTALDSRKALDAIGALSMTPSNLRDVQAWLGDLTDEEASFKQQYELLYGKVASLMTTVPVTLETDLDLFETLLDSRVIRRHVSQPRRILDIGPGAARHLANLVLRPHGAACTYVGVESVGLPYVLQNVVGAVLALDHPEWQFRDQIEYEMARAEFRIGGALEPRRAWHLPLWRADLLPSEAFDVVVCNYVLDELSAPDFDRIVDLVARCLAPEGIVYCRGAQQRSMIKDLYLFGYGTFHQCDITASLRQRGLRARSCELIASTLTRVLVRADGDAAVAVDGYAAIDHDATLVDRVQRDYMAAAIQTVKERSLPLLIWADPGFFGPSGYQPFSELLVPRLGELNVIGVTNEHVTNEGPGPHGIQQIPLARVRNRGAGAVFIAGYRTYLATRELREALDPAVLGAVKQFNWPFAYATVEQTS